LRIHLVVISLISAGGGIGLGLGSGTGSGSEKNIFRKPNLNFCSHEGIECLPQTKMLSSLYLFSMMVKTFIFQT